VALNFDVTTIRLPTSGEPGGTWGSRLVAHSERPILVLSLPRGAGLLPWVTVDLESGAVQIGKGLRGELRDGLASGDEALCLTTHAICRLRLFPEPAVLATYRPRGLGTYLWRMLDFGPDLVGVTGWATKSVLVLRRADGSAVKRIAAIAPQSSIRIDDRIIRLFALHGGEVVDVDLGTLKPIERHRVPEGTRAVVAGAEIFSLIGKKCAVESVDIKQVWRIEPKELVVFDGDLKVVRRVPAPPRAREVLGIVDGTVVIATDRGISVFRTSDLAEVGAVDVERTNVWHHVLVPGDRCVVISPNRFIPTKLEAVRWSA
jgi:hypothetical protein